MTKTTRKPARKAVSRSKRKTATVHDFQPRHRASAGTKGATSTMETKMTQKKQQFENLTETLSTGHMERMEAFKESGTIAMKGVEGLVKTWFELTQAMTERNAQAFKTLIGSKTLNEFTEAHNRLAQQNLDDMMANATRLSEMTVKLTTEAFEPISDQMNRSLQTASKAA